MPALIWMLSKAAKISLRDAVTLVTLMPLIGQHSQARYGKYPQWRPKTPPS